MEIYNLTETKQLRRCLRRNSPSPEKIVWSKLRNRQLRNSKWKRQYSVGKYVIDFYCPEIKLAIEVDGESHFSEIAMVKDKNREQEIAPFGIRFVRFTNTELVENIEGVISKIEKYLTLPLLDKERGQ